MSFPDQDFPTKFEKQLIQGFTTLKNEKEMTMFLRDVFSRAELKEASKRFEIARLLYFTDKPYAEIAADLDTSTTTVTRANDWLKNKGLDGFKTALERLYPDQQPVDR